MKNNANIIRFNGTNIMLIPVNEGRLYRFNSALDKRIFCDSHFHGTYELYPNYAVASLYMVVDTDGTGWNLTRNSAITYNEAVELINHYL